MTIYKIILFLKTTTHKLVKLLWWEKSNYLGVEVKCWIHVQKLVSTFRINMSHGWMHSFICLMYKKLSKVKYVSCSTFHWLGVCIRLFIFGKTTCYPKRYDMAWEVNTKRQEEKKVMFSYTTDKSLHLDKNGICQMHTCR